MTPAELRALADEYLTVHLPVAARAYGKGRTWAYAAADRGDFPVPVLSLGGQRVVRTADLVADLLGSPTPDMDEVGPDRPTITTTHDLPRGRYAQGTARP